MVLMGSLRSNHMDAGRSNWDAITRIIRSAVLVLLMVVGAWTAFHAGPEVLAPASSVTASGQAPDTDALVTSNPASSVSMTLAGDGGGPALGLAACLLGALCGLALVVSFLRLRREHAPSMLSVSPVHPSPSFCEPGRRPVAVTLTQLSISRT